MSTHKLEYETIDAMVERALRDLESHPYHRADVLRQAALCITKLHDALNLAELHNELCEQEHALTGEAAAKKIMGDA